MTDRILDDGTVRERLRSGGRPHRFALVLTVLMVSVAAIGAAAVAGAALAGPDSPGVADGIVDGPARQTAGANETSAAFDAVAPGWTATGSSDVASNPAVDQGTLFVGDGSSVKAYDASSGSLVWSADVDGQVYGTPAVTDGSVYVATANGVVYGLDSESGAVNWDRRTNASGSAFGAFYGSVAVSPDGTLVAVSDAGVAYALAAADGSIDASYDMGASAGRMTPAITPERVYVGDTDGTLHALSTDLSERFTVSVDDGALNSPTVDADSGMVVATTTNGTVATYDDDGTERWSVSSDERIFSSAAIDDGTVVVGTAESVVANALADGADRWRTTVDTKQTFGASVFTANGTVFVGTDTGTLALLNATTGTTKSTLAVADSALLTTPTVSDDSVYVGTSAGVVAQYVDAPTSIPVTAVAVEPSTVSVNETVTVTATLSNTESVAGTRNVSLFVDGTSVQTQNVSVPAGSATDVTFTTTFEAAGEYELAVDDAAPTVVSVQNESDDGSDDPDDGSDDPDDDSDDPDDTEDGWVGDPGDVDTSENVTIESLDIDPTSVTVGEDATFTMHVSNDGQTATSLTVTITRGDEVVKDRTVTIPGNGERTVNVDIPTGEPGTYTLAVDGEAVGSVVVEADSDDPTTTTTGATTTTGPTTTGPTTTGTTPATPTSTNDTTSRTTSETTHGNRTTEDAETPGFGIGPLLGALVAFGLLGWQRERE